MYDTITPEQWIYGLLASLIAFSTMWWLFYRSTRPRDEAPSTMSRTKAPAADAGTTPVHVPVRDTGSAASTGAGAPASTGAGAPASTDGVLPDTDELEVSTDDWPPRLSLRLSDAELIALLAAQRGKDGKHRFSANKIHTFVGGARADVLAQVRAVQVGAPAVFRPLTEEQVAAREALGLDRA